MRNTFQVLKQCIQLVVGLRKQRPRNSRHRQTRRFEGLERREMLAGDLEHPLPTAGSPEGESVIFALAPNGYDINRDGAFSPVDVLILINDLNAKGSRQVAPATPVANDIALESIYQGQSAQVDLDLTGAVTDVDCDVVTLLAEARQGPATVAVDGTVITITPDIDFSGDLTITYQGQDGDGLSNEAEITVFIKPNAKPTVFSLDLETNENITLQGNLLGGDANGHALRFNLIDGPEQGNVEVATDGFFTFTPALGFDGVTSFTVGATDGIVHSDPATVTITVHNTVEVAVADIGVTLTGPDQAIDSGNIVYVATVRNNGPDSSTVTLNDAVPLGLSFVSMNDNSCAFGSNVVCTFELPSGQVRNIAITYSVKDDTSETLGSVLNQAAVVSTTATDPVSSNNVSAAVTTIVTNDVTECSDALDNDGNGKIDSQDQGCENSDDPTEFSNLPPVDAFPDSSYDGSVGVEFTITNNRLSDPDGDLLTFSIVYPDPDLAVNVNSNGDLTVTALSGMTPRTDVIVVKIEDRRDLDGDGVLEVLSSLDARFWFQIFA